MNNQTYTTDTLDKLPGFVQATIDNPPAERKSKDVMVFFTKYSKFSNFYPCKFAVDDISFSSVEQHLSYHKALLYDTKEVADELLNIHDPVDQKKRVNNLTKFNPMTWKHQAEDILKAGLTAKFSQNAYLRDALLSSGELTIGEASAHDIIFGIGLSLQNPNAMDPSRWRGNNMQGRMLMDIRNDLTAYHHIHPMYILYMP